MQGPGGFLESEAKYGVSPFNRNLGMQGPNNVFNTLNYSINSPGNFNTSSIHKTIDHENSIHEQTTMMTQNQSLHQASISHH